MSLNISLLDAVKDHDIDLVKELLQHDVVDVNSMDEVCSLDYITSLFL